MCICGTLDFVSHLDLYMTIHVPCTNLGTVENDIRDRFKTAYFFPYDCIPLNCVAYRRIVVENVELGGSAARKLASCEVAVCRLPSARLSLPWQSLACCRAAGLDLYCYYRMYLRADISSNSLMYYTPCTMSVGTINDPSVDLWTSRAKTVG